MFTSCQMLVHPPPKKMKVQTPGDASSLASCSRLERRSANRQAGPQEVAICGRHGDEGGCDAEADVLSGWRGDGRMCRSPARQKNLSVERGLFHLRRSPLAEHVRWLLAHRRSALASPPYAPLPSRSSCSSLASSLLLCT